MRTAISRLKRRVLLDGGVAIPIETVWGQGYCFNAPRYGDGWCLCRGMRSQADLEDIETTPCAFTRLDGMVVVPDAGVRYGPAAAGGWRVDVELPFETAA